ncbi:MAG: hypothetical protein ACODAD_03305, partial [Planctomycetota bacterium]
DEPTPVRCTAARVIADLDYTDVSGIDPVETAQKLGALAVEVCLNEEAWVEEQQEELEEAKGGRSGSAGSYPGYGMEGGDYDMEGEGYGMEGGSYGMEGGGRGRRGPRESEEARELMNNARRRLKLPIDCARLGIRGEEQRSFGGDSETELGSIAKLATDETEQEKIQEILAALDEMIDATDPPEDVSEDRLSTMMVAVRQSIDGLTRLLPNSVLRDATAEEDEETGLESALPGGELPEGDESPATKPSPKGPPGAGGKPGGIPAKKPGAKEDAGT